MLNNLTLVFACQLAGEVGVTALGLPVPGPVCGMVLLFAYLMFRAEVPKQLATVGEGLLGSLSLLFVPAGVGVMLHFHLLGDDWIALSAALVVSTLATIAVTALLMVRLSGGRGNKTPVTNRQSEPHD